jgi:23S rRNA (uridine2552-2'-O)-methyltransferase
MARTKSSRRWLDRHFNDEYVRRARQDGYRSRAAYKLLEIQEKDRLIRPGMTLLDLGAAPGGWSQVASRLVGPRGLVVALDVLPIEPIANVVFVRGDFREDEPLSRLRELLRGKAVDVVISDMAPNLSGTAADQPRMIYLCELVLDLARDVLKPGGHLAVKIFQGAGFDDYLKDIRRSFARVVSRKPEASRSNSRELYLVAQGFSL